VNECWQPSSSWATAVEIVQVAGRATVELCSSASGTTSPTEHARFEVIKLLDWLRQGAGWDGEGAAAPSPSAIHQAITFLALCQPFAVEWDASMHADGRPTLEFDGGESYAELVFNQNGSVQFLRRVGDGLTEASTVHFDGLRLPEVVVQDLRRLAG
jgi:hypothetical protein